MSAVLFLGPSLDAAEARATYGDGELALLPPATQGDLFRALARRPRAIGLVDGRFDGEPAVLHKEILHALECGVAVLGAASMGALRAAELHAFGMQGVGEVFEGFRDGRLEADDEVALAHAGAEHGFAAVSEALVDIRATLADAVEDGVLDRTAAGRLLDRARALHYPERRWATLLATEESAIADALAAWLPTGRRSVKREDARRLVVELRRRVENDASAPSPGWRLQRSHFFEELRLRAGGGTDMPGVVDELRLLPAAWRRLVERALLELLARREAERGSIAPEDGEAARALAALRARHGLWSRADLDRWLADNGVDEAAVEQALHDGARVTALANTLGAVLHEAVLVAAAAGGELPALRRRAADKHRLLDEQGLAAAPVPGDTALLAWYFRERLGTEPPADLSAHARALGLADTGELLHLLAREYLYSRHGEDADARPGNAQAGPQRT